LNIFLGSGLVIPTPACLAPQANASRPAYSNQAPLGTFFKIRFLH
jgi:hypothetical protein